MLDRKLAPPFIQNTAFNLIQPDKKKLSNGMDLFFIRGGSQDVLKIELLLNAGRWFESKWGASYFTSHQLSKGTRNKTSFQIARLFDQYGSHLEVSPGADIVSISLYTLTKNLKPVLDLLKEILLEPVFPEKELEQSKSIYIQNLKVSLEKTSFLASKYFRKSLFGETHPYGKEPEEKEINDLNQSHLLDHFKNYFQELAVFVSGKIEPSNEKYIIDIFSDWPQKKGTSKIFDLPATKPRHEHIEKAESVQSSCRIGGPSVLRSHIDYPGVLFVSHVLGGYFGSRLMKNIREEKGLTYGIHSSIHPMRHASYVAIGADVNKENVSLTFDEIRKELKRLRSEEISIDELETSRNHFIGSLQSELSTPFAHADKLKTIYLFNLPPDYYQQLITNIAKIDSDRIIEISKQYFNEAQFLEIAVG
jgi:predicted Zn-dependent peptidase